MFDVKNLEKLFENLTFLCIIYNC